MNHGMMLKPRRGLHHRRGRGKEPPEVVSAGVGGVAGGEVGGAGWAT